jgi:hypothetical protein
MGDQEKRPFRHQPVLKLAAAWHHVKFCLKGHLNILSNLQPTFMTKLNIQGV